MHGAGLAGVVEAILRARGAVEIDPNFDAGRLSPFDGFVEVRVCPLEIRGSDVVVGPESNRDPQSERRQVGKP